MQQGSPEWLDLRSKHAITWSEAANALGIGYDSRQLYMKRKLGMVPEKECNWKMSEGQRREPWAAELYYRIMRFCGVNIVLTSEAFRQHPQDRRLGGSVDRIVHDLDTGEEWILEIKTCPGGAMRTEIPISHIVQMHGLCHTYGVHKVHYFCWSQCQGALISELRFDDTLWTDVLYPRYRDFANLWALRIVPPRASKEEKDDLIEEIKARTYISELSCVATKWQQQVQQQTIQ